MAATAGTLKIEAKREKQESQGMVIARRFMRHKLAVISLVLILLIFIASLLAPVITTFPRDAVDISAPTRPGPPGIAGSDGRIHILGIDNLG
ncbi:MAG TPA: ABC transporter permease, partial [Caldilineaceae bacterium]|nr:ABC transporter permease [Caldilineaceae bacterium]